MFERLSRATLAPLAGHMWPEGRMFETPALYHHINIATTIWLQIECTVLRMIMSCVGFIFNLAFAAKIDVGACTTNEHIQ
jgi:hypothetical protein